MNEPECTYTLSGAHMELVPRLIDALGRRGLETVPLLVGGIVPESDRTALLEAGVVAVLGPGTSTRDVLAAISEAVASRRRSARGRGSTLLP